MTWWLKSIEKAESWYITVKGRNSYKEYDSSEAGERTQWLRAFSALAPEETIPSSIPQTSGRHVAHTCKQNTHTQRIKKINLNDNEAWWCRTVIQYS